MDDHAPWSMRLGRWWGVHVRLHLLFVLAALAMIYWCWLTGEPERRGDAILAGLAGVTLLLTSIVVHELAHVVVARRHRVATPQLVIGPWGGASRGVAGDDPKRELMVHLAGPAASASIALASAVLLLCIGSHRWETVLVPTEPLVESGAVRFVPLVQYIFWLNTWLVLVNAIPSYPFDGGRIFRAGLMVIWPHATLADADATVMRLGKLAALGLVAAALVAGSYRPAEAIPAWLVLTTLAALVLFFSQADEAPPAADDDGEETTLGYDFSAGYTSLERSAQKTYTPPQPGLLRRWLIRRREARERQRRKREADEDIRVDRILERLHECGTQSLSRSEWRILRRASHRYGKRPPKTEEL